MSVYALARSTMEQALERAAAQGYNEQEMARALMSEVIAVYKRDRSAADVAHELGFLADNLDDDADYAFMRP
ncbi:hypothetical protein SAMN05216421_0161 [Halopseudomonas xinjiangensis]|uniref:Uncharacterized protein n=1 Tax=Halopseudomonas xinjiangensis TaxID=487184 RepID=A0A1H1LH54_9GAMM|nr:hypothetical protein [Halopseudomonas xinjiangensis]SDR73219.1 hypothetical protein SAMN05216421_0161 [Halopseudomonas xinjiangensis]